MSDAVHAYTPTGQYLGICRDRLYVGDQYLEDLLVGAQGQRISIEEAKNLHPHYTLILAALNSEVRQAIQRRKLTGEAPQRRIYLSYRWESDDHRVWVKELANYLRSRNYQVELDQDEYVDREFLGPARFMARMAECDTAVMILTRHFAGAPDVGEGHRIGWILDEQMLALKLQAQGLLRVVFIEKETGYRGTVLELKPDEVISLLGATDPWVVIGQYFP